MTKAKYPAHPGTANDWSTLLDKLKQQKIQAHKYAKLKPARRISWDEDGPELQMGDDVDFGCEIEVDEFSKPIPKKLGVSVEMAERVMDALCEDGRGDLLLLKDDEIREWWLSVLRHREALERQETEARRRHKVREDALKKLTAEERKLLGL